MKQNTTKVVVDVSISLDGFIAGPGDDREHPLGERGGERIFSWYFSGDKPFQGSMFRPKGANRKVVAETFQRTGVMLTGRRTYDIAAGWKGEHPVNAIPVVVMTHDPPPNPPKGRSKLVFVTDGIESAVATAKALSKGKDVGVAGASVAQEALGAGLVDELHLHIAPLLLGDGVRLFEHLGTEAVPLRLVRSVITEECVHLRYRVLGPARRHAR